MQSYLALLLPVLLEGLSAEDVGEERVHIHLFMSVVAMTDIVNVVAGDDGGVCSTCGTTARRDAGSGDCGDRDVTVRDEAASRALPGSFGHVHHLLPLPFSRGHGFLPD